MKLYQSLKTRLNNIKLAFVVCVVSVVGISMPLIAVPSAAMAQANAVSDERETRRTPALRATVYDQLARAQKTADDGDVPGALAVLDAVKAKSGSMNSYERATMHNFYGFIYYAQDDIDKTIASFKEAVNESPIPVSFEQTALYSLAQLSMAQGQYNDVVAYIERWEALNNGVIPPKNYILKAQALYQNKAYKDAAYYIETAIKGHEDEGFLPDENWLVLQRAIYFEMQAPEKVKDIIIKLIRLYDQPKYWIQLSGMYGELEQEDRQFATMEIAYQRGFITSASDTFNLAQLYYYHGVPFKGAKLMEQAIRDGLLQENLRNLKFLAQAWQMAKEEEKAVPVMIDAAALSDDGKLDAQLALLYYNLDDFTKAINVANQALEKGKLDRPGDTHMVLGLSLYGTQDFAKALEQLAKAEEFNSSRAAARQWRKYVEKEKSAFELRRELSVAP
ncbi:MAG: tetratricopeptide (TPR) repeat protein [Alphaproteobacteria bacterium]|jgi:tetratricopeptide (TPR) repeat protein